MWVAQCTRWARSAAVSFLWRFIIKTKRFGTTNTRHAAQRVPAKNHKSEHEPGVNITIKLSAAWRTAVVNESNIGLIITTLCEVWICKTVVCCLAENKCIVSREGVVKFRLFHWNTPRCGVENRACVGAPQCFLESGYWLDTPWRFEERQSDVLVGTIRHLE